MSNKKLSYASGISSFGFRSDHGAPPQVLTDSVDPNWVSGFRQQIKLALIAVLFVSASTVVMEAEAELEVPETFDYKVDSSWPMLPLPNNWALGELGGLDVDEDDNVWIVQRQGTLSSWERASAEQPPTAMCCSPAPAVIQFDPSGAVLRAWGGPGEGYDWPVSEHGIHVDYEGNVWIAGNRRDEDGMVLKFTADGEFLMQIGQAGPSKGSNDTTQLAGPADMAVFEDTNEVFIADGYGNNRVIVFDAHTGEFKRMWGAYGEKPTDEDLEPYDPEGERPRQFRNVHCLDVATDGMVYVCDRNNNRIQVFQNDGTFVEEWHYREQTGLGGNGPGSVFHISFWPNSQQSPLILTDMANSQVRFLERDSGDVLGEFGSFGNYAGQVNRLHQAVMDSNGNLYTAEAAGKRVQKFVNTSAPR
jgi:hypothetical protein